MRFSADGLFFCRKVRFSLDKTGGGVIIKEYSDRLFLIITHDPSVMAVCDYRIDVGT